MELTRADLKDAVNELKAYTAERVGEVRDEVRVVSRTVQKHDRELAQHGVRLDALDRLLGDVELVDVPADDPPAALTRRDLKVVGGTIVGLGSIIFAWQQALEAFLAFLKASLGQ